MKLSFLLTLGTFSLLTFGHASFSLAATYDSCHQFDSLETDTADVKKLATAYLNGALFREDFDTITPAEIANRDFCVVQSLAHGADANNTQGSSAPLVVAISNGDEPAVRALLSHKANPNTADASLGQNPPLPVLVTACVQQGDAIALDLINAGANPVTGQALWSCASNANDKAVVAMLATGKVPTNQLTSFGDDGDGSDSQTALDASEQRLDAIKTYFASDAGKSVSDKISDVNMNVLYVYYPRAPMLKAGANPDAYMTHLQTRQQNISTALKAKGWSCYEKNCGIDHSGDLD